MSMIVLKDLVEIGKPTSFACDKHHIHYHQSPVQKMWLHPNPDYYPSDELYNVKKANKKNTELPNYQRSIAATVYLTHLFTGSTMPEPPKPSPWPSFQPSFCSIWKPVNAHTRPYYKNPKSKPPKATLRNLNHKKYIGNILTLLLCFFFFLF